MRIRQVKSLKGGETLAESVITEEKEILISKGTILKPEYLDLISFLGIETVCIEDPYEDFESPHYLIDNKKREEYTSRVKKILENHIYNGKEPLVNLKPLSKKIVQDILKIKQNIVIDFKERNGNLYEHTVVVTFLSVMVGRKLKMKEETLEQIALGGLLHDLGIRYITVPYTNYDIENSRTSDLFEYKKHTILAYSALESEKWLDYIVKKMILSHHERKDGSGFPLKQKTKEVECNILQVCDAFDCMISGMECKRKGIQEALEYMVETSDILFERKIVKIIEKIVARYPVGTKVKLNTGQTAVVISQTDDSIRPVIGILDENENLSKLRYDISKDKRISILEVEQ